MKTTVTESGTLVPVTALLDAWASHDWQNGTVIGALAVHDQLIVRTRNSTYEIIVTVPQTAEILVRGGRFFPEFTHARVGGCSLGEGFLKLHGVYVGFQLEIFADDQPSVVTTRIRTVRIIPAQDGTMM